MKAGKGTMKYSDQERGDKRYMPRVYHLVVLLTALPLSGCGIAPSIVVFGAGFPAWLFCMVGGVIATVAVHLVLSSKKRVVLLVPLPLSYPALTAVFAVLIWLLVFHH
jgi:hypothetical protein